MYVTIRPSSIHPENVVELGQPGEARSGDQPNGHQLISRISTDKVQEVPRVSIPLTLFLAAIAALKVLTCVRNNVGLLTKQLTMA